MITVTKEFRTETAHRLANHPGACKFIHGHSYRYEVTVGTNSECNMVIDFKDLKQIMEKVIGPWDHALLLATSDPLLKELLPFTKVIEVSWIPTAENMAQSIAICIDRYLYANDPTLILVSVKIWETATSYAEWRYGAQS